MRVAKLEMKILVTMMLLGFDLTVVDKQGNPTNEIPGPDRNDILQVSIHRRRWSRFV
jgi:sterol 14-demethylase